MSDTTALTLPGRMERLPLTRYQQTIFLIIATAWLFDSMDLAMMTFLLAPIAEDLHLDGQASGILGSASLSGMALGAALAGMLADRFGRKLIFQVSMIVWGAASLLCAAAWSYESLLVFRFLLGFGMGAEFPVAQSLVSEFIPARQRGKYLALLEGFWPIGFVCAGILSLVLYPFAGWRGVFVAEGLPAVFVFIIRRSVPESPRWFAARGRFAEAEAAMQHIEENVERASGRTLPPALTVRIKQPNSQGTISIAELFTRRYRSRTIMIWLLWFCLLLGYYGITTWLGKLLVERGLTIQKSNLYLVLMTLWGIPGFFSAAYFVERWGRKGTICTYVLLGAFAAFLYGQAAGMLSLIAAGAGMQFFFFGMWSALYAYTPELFPTAARATACGTASSWGRVGGLLGPLLVPLITQAWGPDWVFTCGAAAFVAGALSVLILGPETKGRILEEISA